MKKKAKNVEVRNCWNCRNYKALIDNNQPCKRCWNESKWKKPVPKKKDVKGLENA